MDNPFIKKQMDARLEAERDMIVLYAKTCFLNIQVLYGDLSGVERLERLGEEMSQVEHRLRGVEAALLRLGVSPGNICCLDEQERLELFEAHFADPNTLISCIQGLFGQDDLREMLGDLYDCLLIEAMT